MEENEPRFVLAPYALVAFVSACVFGVAILSNAFFIAMIAFIVQLLASACLPVYRLILPNFLESVSQTIEDMDGFPAIHFAFLWPGWIAYAILDAFMSLNENLYKNPYLFWKNKHLKNRVAKLNKGKQEDQLQVTISKIEKFIDDLNAQIQVAENEEEKEILTSQMSQQKDILKELKTKQFDIRGSKLAEDAKQTLSLLQYQIDAEKEYQKFNV